MNIYISKKLLVIALFIVPVHAVFAAPPNKNGPSLKDTVEALNEIGRSDKRSEHFFERGAGFTAQGDYADPSFGNYLIDFSKTSTASITRIEPVLKDEKVSWRVGVNCNGYCIFWEGTWRKEANFGGAFGLFFYSESLAKRALNAMNHLIVLRTGKKLAF